MAQFQEFGLIYVSLFALFVSHIYRILTIKKVLKFIPAKDIQSIQSINKENSSEEVNEAIERHFTASKIVRVFSLTTSLILLIFTLKYLVKILLIIGG